MRTRASNPMLTLLALPLLLVGCQSTPGYAWDEPGHGLLHRPAGQARSLVMDSHTQVALSHKAGAGAFDPWVLIRNDQTPSVVYGERIQVTETSFTRTRDAQGVFRGEVTDRFQQSTFRERITETRR